MKSSLIQRALSGALFAILLTAISACNGNSDESKLSDELMKKVIAAIQKLPRTHAECGGFLLRPFALPMTTADSECAEFPNNYRLTNGMPMRDAAVNIDYADFARFPHAVPSTGKDTCRGLRIHYALTNDSLPLFLFSPENLVRTTGQNPNDSVYFLLDTVARYYAYNGTATSIPWQQYADADAKAAMSRYRSCVRKLVSGKPAQLAITTDADSDPSSTFFPFEEIEELIRHNGKIINIFFGVVYGSKPKIKLPSISAIRFCWAAVPGGSAGSQSMKHDVLMIPILDDTKYDQLFGVLEGSAANLNHRCPPFCDGSVVAFDK